MRFIVRFDSLPTYNARIAQLVEHQFSKLKAVSSNLISRSNRIIMTRVQEKMLERVAKALEEANRIKILELSGENTSLLSVKGVKDEINGK